MEPRDDKEISRILVVNAHPDDADFGVGGTVAKLAAKGIEITYVCCTNGDQGGEESGVPQEEMAATRQREQRDAARALGVKDVIYLNYRDGHLEPTIGLRKDLVRQIRIHKPDRMPQLEAYAYSLENPAVGDGQRVDSMGLLVWNPDHAEADGFKIRQKYVPVPRDTVRFNALVEDLITMLEGDLPASGVDCQTCKFLEARNKL